MKSLFNKKIRGFTLVELLLVVGMIGVLAALALPNFIKYSAKAKQAEAKINLKGAYLAVKTKFGQTNIWSNIYLFSAPSGQTTFGYALEGGTTYNYAGNGTGDLNPCTKSSCESSSSISPGPSSQCPTNKGVISTINGFSFTAWGQIDNDAFLDVWIIDTNNNLVNTNNSASVSTNGSYNNNNASSDSCSDILY